MGGRGMRPEEIQKTREGDGSESAQLRREERRKRGGIFVRIDTFYKNCCRKLSSAALRPIFGDDTIKIYEEKGMLLMLKRFLSLLLCLCMVVGMCPRGDAAQEPTETAAQSESREEAPELAQGVQMPEVPEETEVPEPDESEVWESEDFEASGGAVSGSLPGGIAWSFTEEGILTITGSGEMPDFDGGRNTPPWYPYRQNILGAMIDQGVTRVGASAFSGCEKLESVWFGEDVAEIGGSAFDGCTALRAVTLPENLTRIPETAFYGCASLKEVEIPENVTGIGGYAFYGCTGLRNVKVPDGVTAIGAFAFANCESLTGMVLPEGVKQVSDGLFYGCRSLLCVELPEAAIRIGNDAFCGCSALSGVDIPDTVLGIGSCAFQGCAGLTGVELPAGITRMETDTFADCTGLLGISLPAGLTRLGDGAFRNSGLLAIELPAGVESIGASAFRDCRALGSVTLGQGLTEVGDGVFSGCESLRSMELPESVTSIGKDAFENCRALERITLPQGLQTIGSAAFVNCESLTKMQVPDSVTGVGAGAFRNCEKLESMALPRGLTRIEENLFEDCKALKTVFLPDTVTYIGRWAFYGCGSLENMPLPSNVTVIGESAFAGCGDFGAFDLTGIPQTVDGEISLGNLVRVPEFLQTATGGRAGFVWDTETVPGEKNSRFLAEISQNDGTYRLKPLSAGRFRLVCRDGFTGIRSSRILETKVGLEIRPAEEIRLPSGNQLQLAVAALPGGEVRTAAWSLAPGDEKAASITGDGLLTGKTVAASTLVTVTATLDSGDSIQKTVYILPRATAVGFLRDGKMVGKELEADMAGSRSLKLEAVVQPSDARAEVVWGSGDERVAMVDGQGRVTLLKPGRAVISAGTTDGSGASGQVELQVRYLDPAPVLTLTSAAQTLEPGQTVQLTLEGDGPIDARYVTFSVSEESKAAVDGVGRLTAGETLGEVTVTASLKGDPLLRTAQAKLRIREGTVRALRLEPQFPDDRGYVLEEDGETFACVESGQLAGKAYSFRLTTLGMGLTDRWQEVSRVTYESSNPSVATVRPDGTVTVGAKAEGACVLTARSGEGLDAQAQLRLLVRDSSPRLEESRLTLNSYQCSGVSTGLVESYGNEIQSISMHDYDKGAKDYRTQPSEAFLPEYADGRVEIGTADILKNGTYSLQLRVTCAYGSFSYPIQIKIANSLPKAEIKQPEKFDLFYLDSAVPLWVSAAGCRVERAELSDTDSFCLEWTQDQEGILQYAQDFVPGEKPDTKGTLRIFLEGWRLPVEKGFSLATVTTKPKLTLDPGSSVINPARDAASRAKVYWGSQALDLTDAELSYTAGTAELEARGTDLIFRLANAKGGTVSFTLRAQNWTQAVKLSHKLTVESKLPAMKLRSGSLKLNGLFYWQQASTAVWLTQNNQLLGDVTFVSAAKAGSAQQAEAEKIYLTYDPAESVIRAGIREGEMPKAGNYVFRCTGFLPDGTALSPVDLKITVARTAPRIKLASGSVRMNRYLAGEERASIGVISQDSAYRVTGFLELDDYEELSYADGALTVCLTAQSGNTAFRLTPIVEDVESGQCAALPDSLKLSLSVYNSSRLGVSLSAKGKLDTLVPDDGVAYTVTKLANCEGAVEAISLEGPDGDRFRADVNLTGEKPEVRLTLLEGEEYDTRLTYQIRFRVCACGEEILSSVQKVKVTQSALKVTAPKTLSCYLGQRVPIRTLLELSAPAESIVLSGKTDKAFLTALGDPDNMDVEGNQVSFRIQTPGALKAGKSYAVYLDITPEHNAVNTKPSQVKLTVKALK